jgi:hypothetical protein
MSFFLWIIADGLWRIDLSSKIYIMLDDSNQIGSASAGFSSTSRMLNPAMLTSWTCYFCLLIMDWKQPRKQNAAELDNELQV